MQATISRKRRPSFTMRWSAGLVFAALSVTRLGQATVAAQSTGDYVIGPQDVLTVQVFDQADLGGIEATQPIGARLVAALGNFAYALT